MKVFRALEEAALGKAVEYAVGHRRLVVLLAALVCGCGWGVYIGPMMQQACNQEILYVHGHTQTERAPHGPTCRDRKTARETQTQTYSGTCAHIRTRTCKHIQA